MRRRLRRCRLRHEIRAIKTRPNNPLRFLQRKNSIRRYLANDLTCVARKATFRTQKRFHNKQYTPKSKDQPLESERTHFDIEFNKSNVAMHPNLYFSSFSQNHNRSIKNNQPNNQSYQIIRKNNPKSLNQKQPQQTTHISQSKARPKQTQQAITKKCNVFE